ncbi:hypothetical protein Aeqsu_2281 [Aequorivita sublithincola DSM 14238]|uniref:Bacteriophage abortive infection AbiH n=1 Tax=Aequorivita sublithincola (strain DSM 14238 / LMG 21431 / ACAM 643 / 9-3) TaxID=746697 RepID=I3YXM3_AEQSU|nr:AbiH family protein [Aequorivita sublithincola]AFL81741.1 hypothetical protein Aeqsu_2281 [Aequorivita sublithincola DSM 14238]
MNRIILIGNGFDLAHGLPTSYNNFLEDFWTQTVKNVQKFEGKEIYEDDFISIKNVPSVWIPGFKYNDFKRSIQGGNTSIEFKNIFLDKISEKSYIQNWVDIENEYYQLLKNCFSDTINNNYSIKELNTDFSKVKDLLGAYLLKVELDFDKNISANVFRTRNRIQEIINSIFNLRDFSESSIKHKLDIEYENYKVISKNLIEKNITHNDLSEKNSSLMTVLRYNASIEELKKFILSKDANRFFDLLPDNTLFLNFNYTFTDTLYKLPASDEKWLGKSFEYLHIHGSNRKEDNNPIIFGFGDELDEDYKSIERLDNNDYLENIKSIKYLDTDNYKKLLEFINSGNYQVFMMGHSCGISDRTLLNTIFENENCGSIKVFYHDKGEGKNNFSEIIKNISRNFNDKTLMRDRVVNKTYCEPLN